MLTCCRCKESKPSSEFSPNRLRSRGYSYACKKCRAIETQGRRCANPEATRAKGGAHYAATADHQRARQRAYKSRNKERCSDRRKELRERDLVAYNSRHRAYVKTRPHKRREYEKRRRKIDIRWHILSRLRNRIRGAVYHRGVKKCARTVELLGCSIGAFKAHIESLFKPGMSWANRHLWHIDHKRPCALFDFRDPAQQRECFHFYNLQPLWYWENQAKRDRILEAA